MTVKLWDATGVLQQMLEGHSNLVCAVAFSSDGKLVVSGFDDDTVKLWDAATGALQQALKVDVVFRYDPGTLTVFGFISKCP